MMILAKTPIPLQAVAQKSILNEDHARDTMSSKYAFTPTKTILQDLEQDSWNIVAIMERKSRNPNLQSYSKHLVYLSKPDFSQEVDGVSPHLILENSHDGSSRFSLHVGLLVKLCGNGLVVSRGALPGHVNVRHMGYSVDELRKTTNAFVKSAPSVLSLVQEMKAKQLTSLQQKEMAVQALSYVPNKHLTAEQVLVPRRVESQVPNVWHTYNNIQENLFEGGLTYKITANPDKPRMARTRQVKNVDSIVGLNQKLFDVARTYLN